MQENRSVQPEPEIESSGIHRLLACVLVLALLLRLVHLVYLRSSPFYELATLSTGLAFDEWARRIAAGEWIGHVPFWVDPLYAYVLGIFYALFGPDLLIPRVLNLLFGVATVWVTAQLAWRVWGSRLAAVLAALAIAVCTPAIFYEGQTEKTALTILLLALAFEWFFRPGTRAAVATGIMVGLATLARGNALLFVPAGAIAYAAGWDADRAATSAPRPLRIRRAGLFLAAALPTIGLATLHNYLASGGFVPTTTNLGINLYLGNHDANLYGYYTPTTFLTRDHRSELPEFHAEATRRTGRTMTDGELSRYWTAESVRVVTDKPGLAASRTLHKLQLVLHADEVTDEDDISLMAEYSPVLRLPGVGWGMLLPLAALGAVVGWRRQRVRVLTIGSLLYLATLLPFFILGRLRIQVMPAMAVLGAGAVLWLVEAVRTRDRRALSLAGAVLAAGAVVVLARPTWMVQRSNSVIAINWNNFGSLLQGQGDLDGAIRAFERAVAVDEGSVPIALRSLGGLYRQRGDYARAEASLRRVLALRPGNQSLRAELLGLYDVMLADRRFADDAEIGRRRDALRAGDIARVVASAGAITDRPATDSKVLDADARRAVVGRLAAGTPTSAWIVHDGRDPDAVALAGDIAGAFMQAGWTVRSNEAARVALRPGMVVLAADDPPAAEVGTVVSALEGAGLTVAMGSAYRAYAEERRRSDPNWGGIVLAPDQSFVLVVGRRAPPAAPK